MIETRMQTIRALDEIRSKTGWSDRMIAEKSGVNHSTISRLAYNTERQPQKRTMINIYLLQMKVRGME
jgi:transcriptional regulator with XRE-family HTH domain